MLYNHYQGLSRIILGNYKHPKGIARDFSKYVPKNINVRGTVELQTNNYEKLGLFLDIEKNIERKYEKPGL